MLPQRLRELRKSKRLTAKAFGEKFSLAESTISGYETGARKPDIELVRKFADFFDVSIDYLMGNTNDSETNKKSDVTVAGGKNEWILREIVEKYNLNLVDPREREQLEKIIQLVVSDRPRKE